MSAAYATEHTVLEPSSLTLWRIPPSAKSYVPTLGEDVYHYLHVPETLGVRACESKNGSCARYSFHSLHNFRASGSSTYQQTVRCEVNLTACGGPASGFADLVAIEQHRVCPLGSHLDFNTSPPRCRQTVDYGRHQGRPFVCTPTNPIEPALGNKFQHEPDYAAPGPSLLRFDRYYNSLGGRELFHSTSAFPSFLPGTTTRFEIEAREVSRAAPGPTARRSSVGRLWRHTYDRALELDAWEPTFIRAHRADGRYHAFQSTPSGWRSAWDIRLRLRVVRAPDGALAGFELTTEQDKIERYDETGRLLSITDRAGDVLNFVYDISGRVVEVEDGSGRRLRLAYNGAGQIKSVTVPGDLAFHYDYDALGHLSAVTRPGGAVRQYHYGDNRFPGALTGITDESGRVYARWSYDDRGRAISSEHAAGADRAVVRYNADGSTTVTSALGKQTTYHFTTIHGVKKVSAVEGHPTASCEGANRAYTYTPEGWLASKTDWAGNLTTYGYDSQGRETSRTEAAGRPEARTVTTDWHPTLNLPVRITEPHQSTTIDYDAKGRVLSRVVTPR